MHTGLALIRRVITASPLGRAAAIAALGTLKPLASEAGLARLAVALNGLALRALQRSA